MAKEKEIVEVLTDLYDSLHGSAYARKVEMDGEINGMITWDGGHGLHLWDLNGKEAAYRSFGDFSRDSETLEHAEEAIEDWIAEIQDGEPY